MTTRPIYDDELHVHFLTFSCYKRRNLLYPDRAKRIVIGTLGSRLAIQNGMCLGFVIMPNHVHAIVWFDAPGQLSLLMDQWKTQSSIQIKDHFRREHPTYWKIVESDDAVWQPRYYDFNVITADKLEEKLAYMHANPVRKGLVQSPCDWPWSSARWYLQQKPVGLPIRQPRM